MSSSSEHLSHPESPLLPPNPQTQRLNAAPYHYAAQSPQKYLCLQQQNHLQAKEQSSSKYLLSLFSLSYLSSEATSHRNTSLSLVLSKAHPAATKIPTLLLQLPRKSTTSCSSLTASMPNERSSEYSLQVSHPHSLLNSTI